MTKTREVKEITISYSYILFWENGEWGIWKLSSIMKESESEVAQSCPTLCDPMDTRLLYPWDFLGKSTGVGCLFLLQGTSRPRDRTQVSWIVVRRFTIWASRELWHCWHLGSESALPGGPDPSCVPQQRLPPDATSKTCLQMLWNTPWEVTLPGWEPSLWIFHLYPVSC